MPLWLDLSDNLRVDVRGSPALPRGRNEHHLHLFSPISPPHSSNCNDRYKLISFLQCSASYFNSKKFIWVFEKNISLLLCYLYSVRNVWIYLVQAPSTPQWRYLLNATSPSAIPFSNSHITGQQEDMFFPSLFSAWSIMFPSISSFRYILMSREANEALYVLLSTEMMNKFCFI